MNYTINEKTAIKNKIKSCREVPLQTKMEKGNKLWIFCSTTAFKCIRKIIIQTIASNYALEKTEKRDISGKVVIETIITKEKNVRKALPIFVTNIERTTSTLLKDKRYYQYYQILPVQEILPVLQSWADENEKEIDICDQHLEKMLRKVYPGRQVEYKISSQHKIDHKIKVVNDNSGETQEEENVTQDDRKTENKTQEHYFKIHDCNRNDEEHEQNREYNETEKEKKAEPKNTREEEIGKNKYIIMAELSEDEIKADEVVEKTDNNKE